MVSVRAPRNHCFESWRKDSLPCHLYHQSSLPNQPAVHPIALLQVASKVTAAAIAAVVVSAAVVAAAAAVAVVVAAAYVGSDPHITARTADWRPHPTSAVKFVVAAAVAFFVAVVAAAASCWKEPLVGLEVGYPSLSSNQERHSLPCHHLTHTFLHLPKGKIVRGELFIVSNSKRQQKKLEVCEHAETKWGFESDSRAGGRANFFSTYL